jgi:hypothetical protein
MDALTPEKVRIRCHGKIAGQLQLNGGMDIDEIVGPDKIRVAEVRPFGIECVECAQGSARRIPIATNDVSLQPKPRSKGKPLYAITVVRGNRPRTDLIMSEAPPLENTFVIVIPCPTISPESRSYAMMLFAANSSFECDSFVSDL